MKTSVKDNDSILEKSGSLSHRFDQGDSLSKSILLRGSQNINKSSTTFRPVKPKIKDSNLAAKNYYWHHPQIKLKEELFDENLKEKDKFINKYNYGRFDIQEQLMFN